MPQHIYYTAKAARLTPLAVALAESCVWLAENPDRVIDPAMLIKRIRWLVTFCDIKKIGLAQACGLTVAMQWSEPRKAKIQGLIAPEDLQDRSEESKA